MTHETAGDPVSGLKWTHRTTAKIAASVRFWFHERPIPVGGRGPIRGGSAFDEEGHRRDEKHFRATCHGDCRHGPESRARFTTQADAICDRLLHDAHRIELKGPLDAADTPRPEDRGSAYGPRLYWRLTMTSHRRTLMTTNSLTAFTSVFALSVSLTAIAQAAVSIEATRQTPCPATDRFGIPLEFASPDRAVCAAGAPLAQGAAAIEEGLGLDRSTRRLIQHGLRNEGFDPGAPDGLFGPRTRAAIRAWQASRQLPETGYLDDTQAEALREAAQVPHSPPPQGAATAAPMDGLVHDEARPDGLRDADQVVDSPDLPLDGLVQVDRYLLRIERLLDAQDHAGAFNVMQQVEELYDAYGVNIPPEVDYRYAQIASQAGSFEAARDAADRYLVATGRDGASYRDVLELLDLIEDNQQDLTQCTAASFLDACWRAPAELPQCAIWDPSHLPDRSVAWSGSCVYGRANGEGILIWTREGDNLRSDTGLLQNGLRQGEWVEREASGNTEVGPYVDGIRQGRWILTTADASNNDGRVMQGLYFNGKTDGPWEVSWPSGETLLNTYEGGVLSGPSIRRFSRGGTEEGQYANWEKEGVWKRFDEDGKLYRTETYAAGVLHGPWLTAQRRGYVGSLQYEPECESFGSYAAGQRDGPWTECEKPPYSMARADDVVWSGAYVDGKKSGRWEGTLYEFIHGSEPSRPFMRYGRVEAVFDNGSAVVTAIQEQNNSHMRDECYRGEKTPYVDGKRHGTGWRLSDRCRCFEYTWVDGNRVEEDDVRRGNCNREIFGR